MPGYAFVDFCNKKDAPRITVSISVEGEPWGTCNFRSWQEIIDYLQPRADEENKTEIKNITNEHDRKALQLLKLYKISFEDMLNKLVGDLADIASDALEISPEEQGKISNGSR